MFLFILSVLSNGFYKSHMLAYNDKSWYIFTAISTNDPRHILSIKYLWLLWKFPYGEGILKWYCFLLDIYFFTLTKLSKAYSWIKWNVYHNIENYFWNSFVNDFAYIRYSVEYFTSSFLYIYISHFVWKNNFRYKKKDSYFLYCKYIYFNGVLRLAMSPEFTNYI